MAPPRKRRADDSDEDQDQDQTQRRQRPRASETPDMPGNSDDDAPSSMDSMVKKLVRLAMACEYKRIPLRRTDISTKVLGGSRQFKDIFNQAQRVLRNTFGMEMTELPAKDNVTLVQRRAAQKTERPSTSSKSWILTTTLPREFRDPAILVPTKAPSSSLESTHTALYTFVISLVVLNGGTVAEQKLERYLARMNAKEYTPIEKTDKYLARLCREGYLIRHRQVDSGEEVIEYILGPRGKIEVGSGAVADLVREVYGYGPGVTAANGDEGSSQVPNARREFETRLRRTLGLPAVRERTGQTEEPQAESSRRGSEGPRRSSRRPAQSGSDSEDEDEEEEDSD